MAAAQSFVEAVIGVNDPPLSDFRPGESGAGEIDLERWSEDGSRVLRAASTLELRRLDGERWFVVAAESADVRIDTPELMASLSPGDAVTGQARGFEGTITVELRARDEGAGLIASGVGIAGAAGELEPYSVPLAFSAPDTDVGIVVARDDPGIEMAVFSFSARPVRLADAAPPAPESSAAPEPTTTVPAARPADPGSAREWGRPLGRP